MPTPPTGELYLHFGDFALCSTMPDGTTCPKIPIAATEKFVMFTPQTWANIQGYIDSLIRAVKNAQAMEDSGQQSTFLSSAKNDEILNVLYRIKFSMRSADLNWKKRKSEL